MYPTAGLDVTLTFPNRARSYDESRSAVRFRGYDGLFEVPFLIQANALSALRGAATESNMLMAFDDARNSIYDVAREVYSHGRQATYLITAADFR